METNVTSIVAEELIVTNAPNATSIVELHGSERNERFV